MNRASPLCPETETATRSLWTWFRERNCLRASDDQLGRVGVGLREDLGILDVVEGLDDDLVGVVVCPATHRLQGALSNVDSPNRA